jgi:hypothetical protein
VDSRPSWEARVPHALAIIVVDYGVRRLTLAQEIKREGDLVSLRHGDVSFRGDLCEVWSLGLPSQWLVMTPPHLVAVRSLSATGFTFMHA